MTLLAIETSTAQGGVALLEGGQIKASRQWMRSQSHSELLTAAIEDVLRDSGIPISKVDSLAAGIGPGSFTGIRVAINAVKTLGYARGLSVYCYDSSEILVAGRPPAENVSTLIAINAQKNQFFSARYSASKDLLPVRIEELAIYDADAVKAPSGAHILIGDGADELLALNPTLSALTRPKSEYDFPRAEILAELAFHYRSTRKPLVWKDIQPLYLRTSGAEEKLRGSNVKPRAST
jgi:tRNA threonylcarbamoyladenosine biosynthesis protein TsaB